MAVLDERFPDDIAAGAEGGHADFLVTIVEHEGGHETANLDWPAARGRWNVSRAIEFLERHEEARSHFMKARGRFHQWRFKDWSDFTAARTGNTRGRLVGAGTAWQMAKVYGADEPTFEYVRTLYRIVPLSESIWVGGVLQTRGADYTIDNDTGEVTSGTSWTAGDIEMACEFDVLCRYDTSALRSELVHAHDAQSRYLLRWADIDIVEVREEVEP